MDAYKSFKWFRKSAKQGHAIAQRNLGNSYYFGIGVPEDKDEAAKWLRKAAHQDDKPAKIMLKGLLYSSVFGAFLLKSLPFFF